MTPFSIHLSDRCKISGDVLSFLSLPRDNSWKWQGQRCSRLHTLAALLSSLLPVVWRSFTAFFAHHPLWAERSRTTALQVHRVGGALFTVPFRCCQYVTVSASMWTFCTEIGSLGKHALNWSLPWIRSFEALFSWWIRERWHIEKRVF